VIAVGRGFDWLHLPNKALIIGPFDHSWTTTVGRAGENRPSCGDDHDAIHEASFNAGDSSDRTSNYGLTPTLLLMIMASDFLMNTELWKMSQ